MAGLPVFLRDLIYFPAWLAGITGFVFYSYLLVEFGFLKVFYGFKNRRLVEQRILFQKQQQVLMMQSLKASSAF